MKKLLSMACVIILVISVCSVSCLAEANVDEKNPSKLVSENTEYYSDGSKIVTQIFEVDVVSSKGTITKSGTKTRTGYDSNNNVTCSFTVHGTFTVNTGVSATCTSSTYTYSTNGNGWSLKTASATKSGNSAIGTSTFVRKVLLITVDTLNLNCTLYCNKNGVLS